MALYAKANHCNDCMYPRSFPGFFTGEGEVATYGSNSQWFLVEFHSLSEYVKHKTQQIPRLILFARQFVFSDCQIAM